MFFDFYSRVSDTERELYSDTIKLLKEISNVGINEVDDGEIIAVNQVDK